jgi:hypothetical protein
VTRLLTSLVAAAARERHIQGYRCSSAVYGERVTEITCRLQQKRINWRA